MAEPAKPIIEIRDVSKTFSLQGRVIHALKDAKLTIAKGEFVTLIGASGCGKSTLLRIMAGFETPTSGEALMWGQRIEGPSPQRGMVFQDYALFPWLTVRENIGFGPVSQGWPRARVRETVDRFVEMVGLSKFANAYPHQLSGGMQSRAALARALVLEPDLLLMDEPFAALDIGLKAQLHRLLLRHQREKGTAVLMITHDLMEAVRLADTVLVMAAGPGRIVHQHSPQAPALARTDAMVYHDTAELLRVPAVRAAFGLDALVDEGACGAGEFADTLPPPEARVLPLQPAPHEGDATPTARRMRCG